jgi:DNA-binding MarR family transcriptional regulator
MMLEFFIPSASRRKILSYLLRNKGEEYHLRQLSRNIGEPAPIVKRELDRLERIGFVVAWKNGNQRWFKVNKQFFLLPELQALVNKGEVVSFVPKVGRASSLKETDEKRKTWRERSRKVIEDYGENLKRKRPRHPAEVRILREIS